MCDYQLISEDEWIKLYDSNDKIPFKQSDISKLEKIVKIYPLSNNPLNLFVSLKNEYNYIYRFDIIMDNDDWWFVKLDCSRYGLDKYYKCDQTYGFEKLLDDARYNRLGL